MKIIIIIALVGLVSVVSIFAQDEERGKKTEETIRQIERELAAALMQGDTASVDRILADNYIEINPQGLVRDKTDVMVVVRARASAPSAKSIGPDVTVDETKLRTYGNTAILVGLTTTRYQHMEYQTSPELAQLPAQITTNQERFMKVYSKLDGRWRLVASQTTAIAKH